MPKPSGIGWSCKGLCRKCYEAQRPKKKIPASCHPEQSAHRKGLCRKCYEGQKPFVAASCHPEERAVARGLCESCYQKQWRTPEYNARQNWKPEAVEARRKYAESEAGKESARKSSRKSYAKPERRRYLRQWNKEKPLTTEEIYISNLKKRCKERGISVEDYLRMLGEQQNRCAICRTDRPAPEKDKRWAIDHCHATGKVRGLLCHRCNPGIGFFRDDVELLERAIEYLKKRAA